MHRQFFCPEQCNQCYFFFRNLNAVFCGINHSIQTDAAKHKKRDCGLDDIFVGKRGILGSEHR
jgi:hypothetical protein